MIHLAFMEISSTVSTPQNIARAHREKSVGCPWLYPRLPLCAPVGTMTNLRRER
jgi:hypothetical protein